MLKNDSRMALIKAYEFILDHADDSCRDPVWDFFYCSIHIEKFTQIVANVDLDSEERVINVCRNWAERMYSLQSFA